METVTEFHLTIRLDDKVRTPSDVIHAFGRAIHASGWPMVEPLIPCPPQAIRQAGGEQVGEWKVTQGIVPQAIPLGDRWRHNATGRVAQVVARARTPNGDTIFRWEGGDPPGDQRMKHPDFNREFTPIAA